MIQIERKLLWILALGLIFAACKSRKDNGGPWADSLTPELREVCSGWKNDKFGCEKYRTAPRAEEIVALLFQHKPAEAEIEKLIGEAEKEDIRAGIKTLNYYFDGACVDGRLKDNTVYCLLQLNISVATGKMETGGVICG